MKEFIWGVSKFAAACAAVVFGMNSCAESEWYRESERVQMEDARKRATPHVIREADGCKVYEFEDRGREHYFTRCGDVVTTERTYSVKCGKNCTRQKSEVIETRPHSSGE